MRFIQLLILPFLAIISSLNAQVADTTAASLPVQLTGSVRLGGQFYDATGLPERAALFQFTAVGRLNLRLLKQFNVPIGFALGRQRPGLRFPIYRQFGISPTYKWLRVHAGHRNVRLSRYSLNNHTFLGGGLELEPGKLRVAAMYGRLRRGVRELNDNLDLFVPPPLYDRWAWGGRVGFGTPETHLDLVYFRAEDREANTIFPVGFRAQPPAENLVLGLTYRQRLGQRADLYLELAGSGYNRDRTGGELVLDEGLVPNLAQRLFTPRFSTQTGLAARAGFNYRSRKLRLGADYERIDPGFESMGTYFLTGDWENARGRLGFGLWRNKVNLDLGLGVQRNNLNGQRAETSRRLIGNANLTVTTSATSVLNLNYANFQQDQRPTALVVFNDTLRIAATTENYGGSWTVSGKPRKGRPQGTFTATVNRQATRNDNPLSESFADVATLFANANYAYRLASGKTTFTLAANTTNIEVAERTTTGAGGTLGWRQGLFAGKGDLFISNTYNLTRVNGTRDGYSNVLRLTAGYQLSKTQRLSLTGSWLDRDSAAGFGFSERRGTVGYGWRFGSQRSSRPDRIRRP